MPVRRNPIDEARRRGARRWQELIRDLRDARLAHGPSQRTVAQALGISHQLLSQWERGRGAPDPIALVAWGSAVGLDVVTRAHVAGGELRDAGQLRYLGRARIVIGEAWAWDTEVKVSANPLDHRSIDAVIRRPPVSIGIEVISRMTDAQAQARAARQKQVDAGLTRMLLVMPGTRHNREAVAAARATLEPTFPVLGRKALRDLRRGIAPPTNGILFI